MLKRVVPAWQPSSHSLTYTTGSNVEDAVCTSCSLRSSTQSLQRPSRLSTKTLPFQQLSRLLPKKNVCLFLKIERFHSRDIQNIPIPTSKDTATDQRIPNCFTSSQLPDLSTIHLGAFHLGSAKRRILGLMSDNLL